MMTKKILFLHGFFASGSCTSAQALRQVFVGKAEVLTPDLPLHPNEALEFIEDICNFYHGRKLRYYASFRPDCLSEIAAYYTISFIFHPLV